MSSVPLRVDRTLSARVILEDHVHFIVLKSAECAQRKPQFQTKVNWCINRLESAEVEYYGALFDCQVKAEIWG